jgi:hypothetical protein
MKTNRTPDYTKIVPSHFFSNLEEKTKFNWFAFELALEINKTINEKFKKILAIRGYPQVSLNRACVKLAKLLQVTILRKLNKEIPTMRIDYIDIEKAFPGLNDQTIYQLQTFTAQAWESLLTGCCDCPTACISNKDDYCSMFDDECYYESFSTKEETKNDKS